MYTTAKSHFSRSLMAIFFSLGLTISVASADIMIDGLVDHFDADLGVATGGGGEVTTWANQAAGNNTGGDTHTSVVSGPNGQSMIRFDDASGLAYLVSGSLSSGYTIMAVVRLNDTLDNIGNLYPRFLATVDDNNSLYIYNTTDQVLMKNGGVSRPAANYEPTSGPYGVGDIAILTARQTSNSQELYFNGVLVSSTSTAVSDYGLVSGADTWRIGNSVKGDIGSILVYDNTASLNTIQETGIQLASDYGTEYGLAVHLKLDGNLDNSGYNQSVTISQPNGTGGSSNYVSAPSARGLNQNVDTPGSTRDGDDLQIDYTLPDKGTIALHYFQNVRYNWQTIFDNSVHENQWEMWTDGDGRLRFRVPASSDIVEVDLDNLDGDNQWYHIAVTWDRQGSTVDYKLYVAGVLRGTQSGVHWVAPGTSLSLGGYSSTGNTDGNGIWDDFRIYERVLSQSEIQALIPEPSSWMLAISSIIAWMATRWRRRLVKCVVAILAIALWHDALSAQETILDELWRTRLSVNTPVNVIVGRIDDKPYLCVQGVQGSESKTGRGGTIEAMDAKGRILWRYTMGARFGIGAYIHWINMGDGEEPSVVCSFFNRDVKQLRGARFVRARDGVLVKEIKIDTRTSNNNSMVADLDGDGRPEFIYGEIDTLACHDLPDGRLRWRINDGIRFCWSLPALVDTNHDGRPEIVFGSEYNNGPSNSSMIAVDAKGQQVWRTDGHAEDLGSTPVIIGDVDGDGKNELLKVGLDLEHRQKQRWNHLHVFDLNGKLKKKVELGFTGIAIGDMDGDGHLDGVGLTNTRDGGHNKHREVRCIDLATGQVKWTTPVPRAYLDTNSPIMADVNGDGKLEAIVGTGNPAGYGRLPNSKPWGDVYVLDNRGEILQHIEQPGFPVNMAICDVNDDGLNEVLVVIDGTPGSLALYQTKAPATRKDWPTPFGNPRRDGTMGR